MQKLPIPENIPLRWELWRGFGRPELLASLLFSGVALIGAAIFSAATHRPGVTGSLVLTAIFAFSVCTGLFTKLENNQFIVSALVKRALEKVYANAGITWSTDVGNMSPSQFPMMSDLYNTMVEMVDANSAYGEVATLFYDMAQGADSFLWNGHTNVDMSNDFIVLDTNRLSDSSDNLKKAQYFNLLTMSWQIMSEDRTRPVFLLSDETYLIMDPNIPEPAMYLRNMAKRGRKYEAMLGTVFQSVVDVMAPQIKAYGQALLDNSTYKLLFGTDGKNLKETAEIFMLTEPEQNILLSGKRGRALCLIGGQHVHVDFDIPKYKLDLMGRGGGR